MRIAVVGAGVIGSAYAARLASAGHEVTLVARGHRQAALTSKGLRVLSGDQVATPAVEIVSGGQPLPAAEVVLVAVRATQLDSAIDVVSASESSTIVFLQHLGSRAEEVLQRVGTKRTVLAFPGIGGLIHDDETVEYVEIGAQPTTIDASAHGALVVQKLIASTGMHTALENDMAAWFATHEVFVSCIGAGILDCDGDAVALAHDRATLRQVVVAVHDGFDALRVRGVRVTPSALRVLFSKMPRWFASAYWQRALQGPVGTVALAPHSRASRVDEFPLLCAAVLSRLGSNPPSTLSALLTPYLRPS